MPNYMEIRGGFGLQCWPTDLAVESTCLISGPVVSLHLFI